MTGSLAIATGVGVAAGVAQVAWRLATRRPVAGLQWAGLGLVIVTASIAVVTQSPMVVMLKPTVIYLVVGAAMLQPGWMLRYAPKFERSPIPPSAFVKAGFFVAGLMFVSAFLNLGLALGAGAKTWAAVMAVYPMASKAGSFVLVSIYFHLVARRNKRRGLFLPHVAARGGQGLREPVMTITRDEASQAMGEIDAADGRVKQARAYARIAPFLIIWRASSGWPATSPTSSRRRSTGPGWPVSLSARWLASS